MQLSLNSSGAIEDRPLNILNNAVYRRRIIDGRARALRRHVMNTPRPPLAGTATTTGSESKVVLLSIPVPLPVVVLMPGREAEFKARTDAETEYRTGIRIKSITRIRIRNSTGTKIKQKISLI
ncbi:hypothetical protein EVAR_75525_1 [Eumeta japonica]|uniref:Uncharacterized protein n=1 Tax=Eumeta variegata TaxID=151549 RepID=A0A4C1UIU0_EUMVA|nr:hypothetical protein EVAR_75525_1 [Eumeta japonica]